MILRAFLKNDETAISDLVALIPSFTDEHTRGLAGQAMFLQLQQYMRLNSFFERLSDESGTATTSHNI
jgi:hypothetical protein